MQPACKESLLLEYLLLQKRYTYMLASIDAQVALVI